MGELSAHRGEGSPLKLHLPSQEKEEVKLQEEEACG